MTLQDDFTAAIEQVAADKRQQHAEALAAQARHQEQATAGAEFFRQQFELLDADYQPAEKLPAPDTDPTDIFNILPNF